MADEADLASQQMAEVTRLQLAAHLSRPKGRGPIILDGEPCCRNCEEPIGERRLKALPDTEFCIDCASKIEEQKQKEAALYH